MSTDRLGEKGDGFWAHTTASTSGKASRIRPNPGTRRGEMQFPNGARTRPLMHMAC